jgi:hypothetical protein
MSSPSLALSRSKSLPLVSFVLSAALLMGCASEAGSEEAVAAHELTSGTGLCDDPTSLSCHPPPLDPPASELAGSYVIVSTSPAETTLEELTLGDHGTYAATFRTAYMVLPACPVVDCDLQREEGTYTTAQGSLVLTSNTGAVHAYKAERTPSTLVLKFGPMMATTLRTAQWGTEHLSLRLTREGGRLDFDCAAGYFDGPLVTDPSGRFRVEGRYWPQSGIPLPPWEKPAVYPVVYEGKISGGAMDLEFSVENGPKRTYRLEAQSQGVVFHCL